VGVLSFDEILDRADGDDQLAVGVVERDAVLAPHARDERHDKHDDQEHHDGADDLAPHGADRRVEAHVLEKRDHLAQQHIQPKNNEGDRDDRAGHNRHGGRCTPVPMHG